MRLFSYILLFLIVPLFQNSFANDLKLNESEVTLIIKPNICIAPRGMEKCISSIDIYWQSHRSGDYCLSSNYSSENVLKCWNNSNQGRFIHKLVLTKNLLYWINKQDSNNQIASSILKFAALKPHRKHQRRRNRLPWSLSSL